MTTLGRTTSTSSLHRNSVNLEERRSMHHRPLRGAGRTLSLRGFDLERQSTSQLDDTLGALRPGDLGVIARREGRCRVADTHPVQGIGGFGTELERYSMLEGKGAEDSQIHVAEPRSENGVARHIAISATRPDAGRSRADASSRVGLAVL